MKVVKVRGEIVVAACDKEVLGRKIIDRKKGLKLEVNEKFYKGTLMDVKDSLNLIREASIANLVGSRIIGEALNAGLIHSKAIIHIGGIPHVQIVKM